MQRNPTPSYTKGNLRSIARILQTDSELKLNNSELHLRAPLENNKFYMLILKFLILSLFFLKIEKGIEIENVMYVTKLNPRSIS